MSDYWQVEPHRKNHTIAILACGPSRNLVDLASLRRSKVFTIAINDSFKVATWADILYFCDRPWWDSRRQDIRQVFYGSVATLENDIPGVRRLRNTGPTGLDPDPECLRHGSNSTYQCIHLAYHLGAKRIIVYGLDMRVPPGGCMHAEPRPEHRSPDEFHRVLTDVMLPKFKTLADPLAAAGVHVINASPGSALKIWPIVETGWHLKAQSERG
jgi:hypothetical protein